VSPAPPACFGAAALPNPSLERDLHRHGTWPARRFRSSSASRAKHHAGSGPSAQTLAAGQFALRGSGSASRWRFAVAGALDRKAARLGHYRATIPCGDRDSPSHSTKARSIALVLNRCHAAHHQATALVLRMQARSQFPRLMPPIVPSSWAAANWSLEADLHRHGTWAASRSWSMLRLAAQAPRRFRPAQLKR
jgi:hypothetical protein